MKKYIYMICVALGLMGTLVSCGDDDPKGDSIFVDTDKDNQNAFDAWIYKNYTLPYNIRMLYKMQDIESDHNYTLVPADYDKSIQLAHIVKYAWLGAYDEVAGVNFTRAYVPKVLHFIGSAAYEHDTGVMVLGTAEGGLKVTLYLVNSLKLDRDFLNTYYFKTMHHEFAHILHQTKNYDTDYNLISEGNYVNGEWYLYTDQQAHQLGFVTRYSMSEAREDIAEVTSTYITKTQAEWDAIVKDAGDTGAPIINKKLAFVKKYMADSWGISLDKLRAVVQRRINDVADSKIDLNNLD